MQDRDLSADRTDLKTVAVIIIARFIERLLMEMVAPDESQDHEQMHRIIKSRSADPEIIFLQSGFQIGK
jgi:LmbE family N-acetylglucosaminyl deacetylase